MSNRSPSWPTPTLPGAAEQHSDASEYDGSGLIHDTQHVPLHPCTPMSVHVDGRPPFPRVQRRSAGPSLGFRVPPGWPVRFPRGVCGMQKCNLPRLSTLGYNLWTKFRSNSLTCMQAAEAALDPTAGSPTERGGTVTRVATARTMSNLDAHMQACITLYQPPHL